MSWCHEYRSMRICLKCHKRVRYDQQIFITPFRLSHVLMCFSIWHLDPLAFRRCPQLGGIRAPIRPWSLKGSRVAGWDLERGSFWHPGPGRGHMGHSKVWLGKYSQNLGNMRYMTQNWPTNDRCWGPTFQHKPIPTRPWETPKEGTLQGHGPQKPNGSHPMKIKLLCPKVKSPIQIFSELQWRV